MSELTQKEAIFEPAVQCRVNGIYKALHDRVDLYLTMPRRCGKTLDLMRITIYDCYIHIPDMPAKEFIQRLLDATGDPYYLAQLGLKSSIIGELWQQGGP